MPEVGRPDIALNWDGTAGLMNETTSAELVRFSDLPNAFAFAKVKIRRFWNGAGTIGAIFERNGEFDPDMQAIYERF